MESFNISIIEKLWGEKLDSSSFTWLNHAGILGISSVDILNLVGQPNGSHQLINHRFDVTGWCYGSNLTVRPRPDALAVMFWDNELNQEVWCHVTKTLHILLCLKLKFDKSIMFIKQMEEI